jgi:hypothetical protein
MRLGWKSKSANFDGITEFSELTELGGWVSPTKNSANLGNSVIPSESEIFADVPARQEARALLFMRRFLRASRVRATK